MLNRRSFIKRTGIAAASLGSFSVLNAGFLPGTSNENARILPARLKKGDLIGLVTPGSPITEDQLNGAVEKIERLGFRTTYDDSVLSEYGYFAGRDSERADELMKMFSRPEVKGIWAVRGGYGSIRILDLLDYQVIRANPKTFIGYSDITAIHTALLQEAGLVSYHGPLGISEFNRFSVKSLRQVVMEPESSYKYPYKREKDSKDKSEFDPYTLNGGEAEGLLMGGNISVLDSMIGSRFEPDFGNKIVYLEEVEEKTYRVDKMLYHLLSSTNLKSANGIVMGVFSDCNINDDPRLTLQEALDDLLGPMEIPVSYGLPFGHIDRIVTIPNGIRARMNAEKNSLMLLEMAVQ